MDNKLEQLIINNFSSYEEKISQYIKDLDNANFEITKLKYKLKEEQDNNSILKLKLDNIKKKLENTQSLLEEKNEMYKTQEEAINLQKKEIENYKKNKEKLEVSLNNNIEKYKLKEAENEVLLTVFYNVLSRNKIKYELNIKKLSSEVMQEVERLNKEFIFFK